MIGFSGGSECSTGACYCCGVNADPNRDRGDCPGCPLGSEDWAAAGDTLCHDCRRRVLGECPCGAFYFEIKAFRELPLEQVFTLDAEVKLEVRMCDGPNNDGCGELVGIRINRDGRPLPGAA